MYGRLLRRGVACVVLSLALAPAAEARLLRPGCCVAACGPCAPACDVVYDLKQVTCYRTVFETAYREVRCKVNRVVYETATRECRDTVCRFVTDFVERQQCCTVMKPVFETVQQPRCRIVCEPVTTYCTVCQDQGHWEMRPAPSCGGCGNCQACCRVWVPNIVQKQVPVTRYVPRTIREVVPVRLCRFVPETVQRTVKVPIVRTVSQEVVRKVPYVTCRTVCEEVVRKIPYCTCRQVPYTVQVKVPRYVPRATCAAQ